MNAATPVVLGAGPTGLSAALNLGSDAILVEREERVGGSCRSSTVGGFTFDLADHVTFTTDPYVDELYRLLLGNNVHWQEREAWIYSEGVHTRYPNGNGNGNGNGHANGHGNGHANGNGHRKPVGTNARFGYPLKGGFQALMDGFLPHIRCELRLESEAVRLSPSRRTVVLSDGSTLPYETVISTIPLPRLVRLVGPEAPSEVRDAAAGLQHLSVRRVNLGVGRTGLTDKHWIYYPEETVFQRVFMQGNASPHCNPPGGFGLTCEITYSKNHPLPSDGDELVRRCVEDCRRVGLIGEHDRIWTACQADLPFAYVVHDHERSERAEHIRAWLLERDVLLAGRFSEWEDNNSDHAFVSGRDAAIASRKRAEERQAAARRTGRQPHPFERAFMPI